MVVKHDGICSCCGREGIYVLRWGLCRNCYERFLRNGHPELAPSAYELGSKPDGWRLLHIDRSKRHFHFMCENCGRVVVKASATAKKIVYGEYHPCECGIEYYPRTEKQERIVELYRKLGYRECDVAKELGITRQAVSHALKACKRKTRRAAVK